MTVKFCLNSFPLSPNTANSRCHVTRHTLLSAANGSRAREREPISGEAVSASVTCRQCVRTARVPLAFIKLQNQIYQDGFPSLQTHGAELPETAGVHAAQRAAAVGASAADAESDARASDGDAGRLVQRVPQVLRLLLQFDYSGSHHRSCEEEETCAPGSCGSSELHPGVSAGRSIRITGSPHEGGGRGHHGVGERAAGSSSRNAHV